MQTINDPNEWIEDAISKKHIKYYKYEDFRDVQKIGSGNFGKVYRANWKNLEQYFALKSLSNLDNKAIKEVVKEIEIHRDVHFHNNIISFFGITTKGESQNGQFKKYLLVMEYANDYRETIVPGTPIDYSNLYTECWNGVPDNRPTMDQIN
ncbi:unnamed protein product [Rhizophagus irregularis]|uniref:Protein kinase domain-containing protein n=1 Tax=Rhizophagus irregularis TaxID=588596 RepID=A0A915Z155_9GLOM|nr:unnamed protein product [Rhizophagus irregularis]